MTELMQVLYDYVLNTHFTALLNTGEYRSVSALTDWLSVRLGQELTGDALRTAKHCQDAMEEQHDLELEAMFLSALALVRELR